MKREFSLRRLLFQTAGFFFIIAVVYLVLFLYFRDRLDAAGTFLMEQMGAVGVWLFVFLVDTVIVPATADLVFPFAMQWNPWVLIGVLSSASIAGGFAGYWIARLLSENRLVNSAVAYYREQGESLVRRYGIWAIVLAGFTPLPYSTISWIGGMLKLDARMYLLGSLSRIPRFALYYLLIRAGYLATGV